MTTSARNLLESFQRLTEGERREVACEILRLTNDIDHAPLDDETFGRLADEAFLEYDVHEAADAGR